MIKNYEEFLNESVASERAARVGRAFIEALEADKESTADSNPANIFEDWWCVPGSDYDNEDVGYLESIERVERMKPRESRTVREIWMFEYLIHVRAGGAAHVYRLGNLDTRNYKLYLNNELEKSYGKRIREIYSEVLMREFPEEAKGQKYGV